MAAQGATPDGEAWGWLACGRRPLCGSLIFARGVAPEQLIEACGLDAGSARLVPGDRLGDELPFPVFDQNSGARCPYVRAGRAGAWAFALDEWMLALHLEVQDGNVWQRLSAGIEVVVVSWTEKPNETFEYWADGEWVTCFEPGMAWNRGGGEPDRFVPEMRRVGLQTEPGADYGALSAEEQERILDFDTLVAALDMVTLVFGIRLPEEVLLGPLLTAQCNPGQSPV